MNYLYIYFSYFLFLSLGISCNNKNNNVDPVSASELKKSDITVKKPCDEIVVNIIMSSKEFIELTEGLNDRIIANGGSGYLIVLENNSDSIYNKEQKKSAVYNYSLRENYPDRATPIAKFIFDPNKLLLYQEDMSEGTLKRMSYDKAIVDSFLKNCYKDL